MTLELIQSVSYCPCWINLWGLLQNSNCLHIHTVSYITLFLIYAYTYLMLWSCYGWFQSCYLRELIVFSIIWIIKSATVLHSVGYLLIWLFTVVMVHHVYKVVTRIHASFLSFKRNHCVLCANRDSNESTEAPLLSVSNSLNRQIFPGHFSHKTIQIQSVYAMCT